MSRLVLILKGSSQRTGLRMTLSLYLMLIPASASGRQFGEWKALKSSELTLIDRLPLNNLELKNILTSGTRAWPSLSLAEAISTAEIRFSLPSVRGTPIGS